MEEDSHSLVHNLTYNRGRLRYNPYYPTDFRPAGDLLEGGEILEPVFTIAARNNERMARKMDAAKFLDEAKRGLWNDPKVPSFQILKRIYDNQAFHFRDEKN